MEDISGKQLGPYQVIAPLGEGGMASVYRAYQPGVERYVALKILPRHFANDPQFVARFEQEAKMLAQLQHPHILPVFDFGQADSYTYIVMPLLESGDLTDLMEGQPRPLEQIRRIISQIGDALDYAHQRGLIHRDVKPSNVLLDERGNCLLMDFGIAKIVEGSVDLTATGGIIEKPPGSLAGSLVTGSGEPIANAAVEACVERINDRFSGSTPCSDHPFVAETNTDAAGDFALTDLPTGRYRLAVMDPTAGWVILTDKTSDLEDDEIFIEAGQETNLLQVVLSLGD